jgi:carboxypeptidase family protein
MSLTRAAGFARHLALTAIAVGLALAVSAPTSAQTIRATLTGSVIDANGGVVQGAAVTATNIATNISTATKTNQEGIYTFTALPPGEYVVEVGVPGFKRNVQSGVILQIAQATRLDVQLEVGTVTEEVRVASEAPLVRSTSSELGQVIDYKQIQSLPLNGRLFQQLITLSPAPCRADSPISPRTPPPPGRAAPSTTASTVCRGRATTTCSTGSRTTSR